jgi:hypothetical protein
MIYPKEVMTIKELVNMGFSRKELLQIYRQRGQSIAWKSGTGGETSTIYFSTQDLEKYRKAKCTGV